VTKTARKKRATDILHALPFGERINPGTPLFVELVDLLSGHEDWDGKVGAGIAYFEKRQMQFTPCFWIVRTEGVPTDIGISAAISGVPRKQRVCSALRTAIRPQIQEYIANTAVPAGYHVDHVVPFDDIAQDWLNMCRMSWTDVGVVSRDGQEGSSLTDEAFANAWCSYHAYRVKDGGLQAIPSHENLSKGKRRA
jgi:Protein of unknown function (DUF3223)